MADARHPDHERVQRVRAGDPEARRWLVAQLQRTAAMVRSVAGRKRCTCEIDLDDAAQEAAATAIRRLAEYEGRSDFGAWLYVVCVWTVRGLLRRERRRQMPSLEVEPPDSAASPVQRADDEERLARVRRVLEELGGVEADIIRMRHYDWLDFRDIAARLDIPMATVRTRYYRGLKRMQHRLADLGPGAE